MQALITQVDVCTLASTGLLNFPLAAAIQRKKKKKKKLVLAILIEGFINIPQGGC